MSILNIKNKKAKEATTHVGVQLSTEEVAFLSLYCVSEGSTKSEVIRTMFEHWIKEKRKKKKFTVKNLTSKIAEAILPNWIKVSTKVKNITLNKYLIQVKTELEKKGLDDAHSELIIKKIQDGA